MNKSKSTEDDRLVKRIKEADAENKKQLKKRNKRDYILFGGLAVFYVLLAVVQGIAGNWDDVVWQVLLLFWIAWILVLNLQINMQQFVIDMQHDLRKIETEELLLTLKEVDEAKAKKAKK